MEGRIRISSPRGRKILIKFSGQNSYIKDLEKADSPEKLDNLIEEGLPYYSVKPMFDILSLNQAEQAKLVGVEPRTISNWVKKHQSLGKTESMYLIDLDTIVQLGVTMFGDEQSFLEWFITKNHSLGDKSPKECVLRPSGLDMVEDALHALEFGSVL